jgi:hypothetical protein
MLLPVRTRGGYARFMVDVVACGAVVVVCGSVVLGCGAFVTVYGTVVSVAGPRVVDGPGSVVVVVAGPMYPWEDCRLVTVIPASRLTGPPTRVGVRSVGRNSRRQSRRHQRLRDLRGIVLAEMDRDALILVIEHREFEPRAERFEVLAQRRDANVVRVLELGDRALRDLEPPGESGLTDRFAVAKFVESNLLERSRTRLREAFRSTRTLVG